MVTGKIKRLKRIMPDGKVVIVPMDHGVTMGPIPGLIRLDETINRVAEGGANAIVEHNGMVGAGHRRYGKDIGLIIHLSASTSLAQDPNHKVLVCSVEKAIKLWADAVSIHINLGAEDEPEMLRDFGFVSERCLGWGIPLLAMVYPRGRKVPDERDPEAVKLAARLGAELGADIVKVPAWYDRIAVAWEEAINHTDKYGVGGHRPSVWADIISQSQLDSMPPILKKWSDALALSTANVTDFGNSRA